MEVNAVEQATPGPEKCEECGKNFKNKNSLKSHISNTHKKKKEFTCDVSYKNTHQNSILIFRILH